MLFFDFLFYYYIVGDVILVRRADANFVNYLLVWCFFVGWGLLGLGLPLLLVYCHVCILLVVVINCFDLVRSWVLIWDCDLLLLD